MDGVIYPLAQELVNQARNPPLSNIPNATLSSYNLGGLESKFNSNPKEDISHAYQVQKGGEYLSDIARKFDVSPSNIFYFGAINPDAFIWGKDYNKYEWKPIKERKKIWENRKKVTKKDILVIVKEKYKNEISAVFSYKWYQDLDNDGKLGFNEFNQIKRTFYNDEDFNIGIKYQTEKDFTGNLEMKILEDSTGKIIVNEKMSIALFKGESAVGRYNMPAGRFPIGVYIIHTNLNDDITSRTVSSSSEKFEIIQN